MIKVRAGQVWSENYDRGNKVIDEVFKRNGKPVKIYIGIRGLSVKYFYENFTFNPANDLEKLAINETEWLHSGCDFVR